MHSPRVLGLIALAAIAVAGVSFAVVDVSAANGCVAAACSGDIPVFAITFALLGAFAALVAVVPAVSWVVNALREAAKHDPESDRELTRAVRTRGRVFEEDL